MRIYKLVLIFIFLAVTLLMFIVLFDLASYDSSYINRNALKLSVNNLNSRKTIKIFHNLENLYNEIGFKIFKKNKEYWKPELSSERENLPKIKIIFKKKENFLPGKKINEVEKNFSDWPRSHGGFSSMRFSSLEQINKNNVKNLKLAWIYNSKDGRKGIESNPVVYKGLVYMPTPGNYIVCLDGTNGKEIWRYKVEKGYHAAKRGLLVWEDKENNIIKLYFTNDDQLISLNAITGEPIKSFGINGIIKIGSSPIPPVIIDDRLVVATFRPSIEVYDIQSGKLDWKYYLREFDKKVFGEKDFIGGNPWGGISADIKKGVVFLTTGNPKPNYVGTY